MSKEELKPIDVSKYTVTESGNVIKSEEKKTTKEDFFRQNFSEYCVGDTFLSPYWDLFEAGYELKQNILSQHILSQHILSQHILELQADKGRLTDRVRELEKENARLVTNEKSLLAERKIIAKENTEAKNLIEELASSLSVVGECGEEECELINKAQKFINKPIF